MLSAHCLFCTDRCVSVPDDVTGMTPVMVAVETGDVDCVKELLIQGARLDIIDKQGCTVFHYAAKAPTEAIIQVSFCTHFYTSIKRKYQFKYCCCVEVTLIRKL